MTTTRPTKTFETEAGIKIVYNAYATGGEYNDIQSIYTAGAKISLVNGQPQVEGFDPTSDSKVKTKLIELLVQSVDDETENLVEAVENLPADDYLSFMEELEAVSGKKKTDDSTSQ